MSIITIYQCGWCGDEFDHEDETEQCELCLDEYGQNCHCVVKCKKCKKMHCPNCGNGTICDECHNVKSEVEGNGQRHETLDKNKLDSRTKLY